MTNELICSLATMIVSAIIRAIEKRRLRKKGLLVDEKLEDSANK